MSGTTFLMYYIGIWVGLILYMVIVYKLAVFIVESIAKMLSGIFGGKS